MYGTIGLTKITKGEISANQALCALIPPFQCDVNYLYHHLDFIRSEWKKFSGQTTQPNINGAIVRSHVVPLPPIEEQEKIAEILDTLDTAIHQTEAIIEKLKQVKQGLLHDLLKRGVDANGKLRPSYEQAPELYQASPLGWIPKDWLMLGLADFSPVDRSVIRTGPFGSSLKGEHWRETGRAVVTIGSLGVGIFIEEELLFVDEVTARRLNEYQLALGDIAFSRVADVGRSVVINNKQVGWIMSSNFMRISLDNKKVNSNYFQLTLSDCSSVKKQMRSTINSAGRDVANSAILMGLRFPIPNVKEQDEIVRKNNALSLRIEEEAVKLKKLLATKSALMDDLLTGCVRVTPLLVP